MNGNGNNRVISANIHITGDCNYDCRFCFSRNRKGSATLRPDEWFPILKDLICVHGIDKVNFAGGEPLLYPGLGECIRFCKQLGATTSVVTNGSILDRSFLEKVSGCLDWIGLSIDSVYEDTEFMLGRNTGNCNHLENVLTASTEAKSLGLLVKLNVTVTRQSVNDDFHDIVDIVSPDRLKFLQVSMIPGTNDEGFMETSVPNEDFEDFIRRHSDIILENGSHPVFETSRDMMDSYLMLDSLGRIRLGTTGGYVYMPYQMYWNGSLKVNEDAYVRRGGLYRWSVKGAGE